MEKWKTAGAAKIGTLSSVRWTRPDRWARKIMSMGNLVDGEKKVIRVTYKVLP